MITFHMTGKSLISNTRLFIRSLFKKKFYGFIQGHSHLDREEVREIQKYLNINDFSLIEKFEQAFACLLGKGKCVSYASARMGFFSILKELEIKENDEIILTGFTCSVMVNAVLRFKAKPVYADIDNDNLGTSYQSLKKLVNEKTKVIVAQHSFGIPCDIKKIKNFAKTKKIFLIEDCAITLGSEYEEEICGNFGDAAIFSTDHTKPINTIIGGMVYTKNLSLYKKLKKVQLNLPHLDKNKQMALWRQFLLERKFCNPEFYGMFNLIQSLLLRLFQKKTYPFLDNDNGALTNEYDYPYPSLIPFFLARLGLIEIENWNKYHKNSRKNYLQDLITILDSNPDVYLPEAYYDSRYSIVPLRFVFFSEKIEKIFFKNYVDHRSFWFTKPIINASCLLEDLNYSDGECINSEKIGGIIFNLPCNLNCQEFTYLKEQLDLLINYN